MDEETCPACRHGNFFCGVCEYEKAIETTPAENGLKDMTRLEEIKKRLGVFFSIEPLDPFDWSAMAHDQQWLLDKLEKAIETIEFLRDSLACDQSLAFEKAREFLKEMEE